MNPKLKQENYTNFGGMNIKTSPYVTGPFQFLNLVNVDFATPGALTKREGSTLFSGGTVTGRITGLYEFVKLSGASYIVMTANTNAYTVTQGGAPSVFKTSLQNSIFDFVTFVDRLFMANGNDFLVYDGTTTTQFSLPPGLGPSLIVGQTGTGGFTGFYTYAYGYLNDRGYVGPVSPVLSDSGVSFGGIFAGALFGFTTPAGYGITSLVIYRTSSDGTDLFQIGTLPAGGTLFFDPGLELSADAAPTSLWFTLAPRYIDLYNNQLFMSGFSSMLSTVYFSDIGEPESIDPEYNFEVRTNDGDRVTGHIPYNGGFAIFKSKSFHLLSGDGPGNFLLKEVTTQYGCLSNRAAVTYNDLLLFLDEKGVVEFNGANVRIISDEVEEIFKSMNLAAALDNAVARHIKEKNQIWFAIPCNGATYNNCIVVYDYLMPNGAWTTYSGVDASSLSYIQGPFNQKRAFIGSYTGAIFNFGASLFGDNGMGITALIKPRFLSEMGKSVTEQYRRLYLDCETITGATAPVEIDFFTNYGSSVMLSRTMYMNPFQSRIDFGLPAKSLAFEITQYSATLPLKIYGFTIESRLQRKV